MRPLCMISNDDTSLSEMMDDISRKQATSQDSTWQFHHMQHSDNVHQWTSAAAASSLVNIKRLTP